MKTGKKRKRVVQMNLFGEIERKPDPEGRTIPFDFETHAVRVIVIKGEPWWVGADVCRAIGVGNSRQALVRLPDDEKGVISSDTLGGKQSLSVVNEAGLYRLIFESRKPEAERFKKWVFAEVLPSIRKTGSYSIRHKRISVFARRRKCSMETAEARDDLRGLNADTKKRMHGEKAKPNDFRALFNEGHKRQFQGRDARQLREALGVRRGTPLDHMERVALSVKAQAMAIFEKQVVTASRAGRPIPLKDQPALLGEITECVNRAALSCFGDGAQYGVLDDPKRGPVIDIVQPCLN